MSYEHGTPFINLPQTTGDDKRDWFDTNAAFLELDSKLKAAYEGSIDTADALAALTEIVSGISTNVETLEGTVGEHTSSISTINEALTLINSALTSLNTSVQGKFDSAGIADPYDAEHGTYDVGDVVTYNGQRYECVTAVTAAEPFDADKWNAVDVQTKLDEINTALSDKADKSYVEANEFGTVVNVTTDYTIPSDGYLNLRANDSGSLANCRIIGNDQDLDKYMFANVIYGSAAMGQVIFVRKGMMLRNVNVSSGATIKFHPLT